jgi:outer membrane protein
MLKLLLILNFLFLSHSFGKDLKTLLDSYKKSEDFQNALNEIELFKATEDKTFGNVLPTLELNSNFTQQDATNNSFIGAQQRQTFLTLRQPLFRGFSEFAAIDYAQKLIETKKLAKLIVKQEVQLRIADLAMQSYQLKQEKELIQELLKINNANYNLIQKREQIGKSKKSDLLRAKANVLQLKAQLTQLNEQLETTLIDLNRVTGFEVTSVEYNMIDQVESFNIDNHPSVKAAKILYESGDDLIKSSKGNHYPEIDLSANYYLEQEGVFNQREWDMALNLTFPLYEGGRSSGEIREQELIKKRNFIMYEKTKKDLATLLKKLATQSKLIKQQLAAYDSSVKASYSSYQEILKDYKLRLTTNLDLNNALEVYLQEKRNLIQLESKEKFIKLQESIIKGL